ncbi:MAG: hypothetical protein NZ930_08395, partial [Candidatus Bipolaricaulota bacterium]|nr:hypothetical protein [Candidatus Bipolaricaulota bacterium]
MGLVSTGCYIACRYIIEIENEPVRKALIGASILADYSIRELQPEVRPRLIFVVYTEQGIKQISNFREKLTIAKQYRDLFGDSIQSLTAVKIYHTSIHYREVRTGLVVETRAQ